ncbi:site-specific integrase [Vineibacter terrae]|nr:site-specific integrase [Vineibacter terrae]
MGREKYLIERDGRYFARIVVPAELRRILGKTELRQKLGPDRKVALKKLPRAVADLQDQLDAARLQASEKAQTPETVARLYYERELARDEQLRFGPLAEDSIVEQLLGRAIRPALLDKVRREAGGGSLAAVEPILDAMIEAGDVVAARGTPIYLEMAKAILRARTEAVTRQVERDGADFSGKPTDPILIDPAPVVPTTRPLSVLGGARVLSEHSTKTLSDLLPMFQEERRVADATADEYRVAVRMAEEHFGTPKPICEITRQDILAYKRALLRLPNRYTMRFPGMTVPEAIEANQKRATPYPTLSPATIRDKWLAHLRSVLGWCADNGIIPDNPAAGVKVDEGNAFREPSRYPFTPGELAKIFGPPLFAPEVPFDTRHWALLLALFTGARSSSELARLRLDEIYTEQGVLVFHLAGASKNVRSKRIVPVHDELIRLGLREYVQMLRDKHETLLFPDWKPKDKINDWFNRTYRHQQGVTGKGKVFHSFRHTLKTALARAGVAKELNDLITGHADQTVSGTYIHDQATNMIVAMAAALNKVTFDGVDWRAIRL